MRFRLFSYWELYYTNSLVKYPYLEKTNELQKSFISKFNSSLNIKYEYIHAHLARQKKNSFI